MLTSACTALQTDSSRDDEDADGAGLVNSTNALVVRDPDGVIVEAVSLADSGAAGTATGSAEALTNEASLTEPKQWTNVDGSVPTSGFVDEGFRAAAVLDLNLTTVARPWLSVDPLTSLQRVDDMDRNTKADWDNTGLVSSTWGIKNTGQLDL